MFFQCAYSSEFIETPSVGENEQTIAADPNASLTSTGGEHSGM